MRTAFLLLGMVWHVYACGQNFLMDGSPITTCQGNFYDSGGSSGQYSNNQNLTTVLCPGNGKSHLRLNFSGIALGSGDALCFFDGTDRNAPLLACASNYPNGQPFVVQATATNNSGCLTAVFISDATRTEAGWSASISCTAPCQQVIAEVTSTQPVTAPADTGWIDVCPGQAVSFIGRGVYPQNNASYAQSDATSRFEWQLGDGTVAATPVASHRYSRPGGYTAQLFITDEKGCRNTSSVRRRVRVAPRPAFSTGLALPDPVCAGDTLTATAIVGLKNPSKNLSAVPQTAVFYPLQSRYDSLALPDGIGTAYETDIWLTNFAPNQTLNDATELEEICVNMEHSWARDLEIKIICPNGQSAVLHNFVAREGNKVLLGQPNDNDVVLPLPGKGYDYCWNMNNGQSTWLEAAAGLGMSGTLPAGTYAPAEPFSRLTGCPLNGSWAIRITDQWQSDNGFIFSWGLKFKNTLYRRPETFAPVLQTGFWTPNSTFLYESADSARVRPPYAGLFALSYTAKDAFGCSWDTTLSTRVLPLLHPDCVSCADHFVPLRDTTVCVGEKVLLNRGSIQGDTLHVGFAAYPAAAVGHLQYPPGRPYSSSIEVSNLGYNTLTNAARQLQKVCVDITTDRASDLILTLRSPDGREMDLSSGNGGSMGNYGKTCFSPGASVSVVGAAAPLTGIFQPEGSWSALDGATVQGNWQLLTADADGAEEGLLNEWSIQFAVPNPVQYLWEAHPDLSCTTCPAPLADVQQNTVFRVTTRDALGCSTRDSASVEISAFLAAPGQLEVAFSGPDFITWQWQPVSGISDYEVRIGGGAWQPSNAGSFAHTVFGLVPGDVVEIEVRAVTANINCRAVPAGAAHRFVQCAMTAQTDSLRAVRCAGNSDGSAYISLQNARLPAVFFANGLGSGQSSGLLTGIFSAGPQFVVIRDADGCRDTVSFVIPSPAALTLVAEAQPARCHGEKSGEAVATVTGGTGPLRYQWRACAGGPLQFGPSATQLAAGCYSVTATDANGCTAVGRTEVTEPTALMLSTEADSLRCFNGADGRAVVRVLGGLPAYRYTWSNGVADSLVTTLTAGIHTVRVQDAANCEAVAAVTVAQPPRLVSDSVSVVSPRCAGDTTARIQVFPSGGTGIYTYLWENGQNTPFRSGIRAGNYPVTISDSRLCTLTTSAAVVDPPPLRLIISQVQAQQCADSCDAQVQLRTTGGTAPYQLRWDDVVISKGDTLAQNVCAGIYPVNILDNNGCLLEDTVRVGAAPPVIVQFISTAPTCADRKDGLITATVNGGRPPYTYLWSNGATTARLTGLACGEYALTVTDAAFCKAYETVTLQCPDALRIDTLLIKPVRCFGESSGELVAIPAGGHLPYRYIWSDPNRQVDSTAMNLASGTYTVTVSDARGCTVADTAFLGQPDPLNALILRSAVRCFGGSDGEASVIATGGKRPFYYEWSNMQNDSVITGLRKGDYSITVRDVNGCIAPVVNFSIEEPATAVTATAVQYKKACAGMRDGQALARGTGGTGAPYTFLWSNGSMDSLSQGLSVGVFSVQVSDQNGCTATAQIQIEQLPPVEISMLSTPTSCFGRKDGTAVVNLLRGGDGGGDTTLYRYHWSVPGISPLQKYARGLAAGRYYITVSDLQGCSDRDSIVVLSPRLLQPILDARPALCYQTASGSARVMAIEGGNSGMFSYHWNTGDSTTLISNVGAGWYHLTLTDSKGCEGSDSIQVKEPPALTLQIFPSRLKCSGDTTGIVTAIAGGGTPGYQFLWNTGRSGSVLLNRGAGRYSVTVTDQNGCTRQDTTAIAAPDSLSIAFDVKMPRCYGGDDGRFSTVLSGGTPPFRFSLNEGPLIASSVFLRLEAGLYRLRTLDGNGCVAFDTVRIKAPLPIQVGLPPDTTLILGDGLDLFGTVSNAIGAVRYTWKPVQAQAFLCLDTPECSEIRIKPLYTNTYRLIVTDAQGCTGEGDIVVRVDKPRGIYVPSGFSPNDDTNNDLLVVHGISGQVKRVLLFRVYDRLGELVWEDRDFAVNDAMRGWDGRFRNQPCQAGVYVWTLEAEYADGYTQVLKGEVTLVR